MEVLSVEKIERKRFYDVVRQTVFKGKLKTFQVQGMEVILNKWEEMQLEDMRWLAYMLATAFHETDRTMQPVAEWGKGYGKDYGKKLKYGKGPGRRVPYDKPDKIYYGRGYVQLTWYENYEEMGMLLDVDLLNNPDYAMHPPVAADILFEGMLRGKSNKGDFTGASLEHFFNATTEDWVNARKIVNGLDRAELIAAYGRRFYEALV